MFLPRSRRGFLKTAGAGVLGAVVLPRSVYAADSYDALRARWRDLLTGTGFDPSAEPYTSLLAITGRDAASFRSSMTPGGSALWPDLPLTESLAMATSYYRLRTMALAYVQPGTGLTGNAGMLADLLTGLDYMYGRVYNESSARFDNWYHWLIGAPEAILDIETLIYDKLTPNQIANYTRAIDHFAPTAGPPGLGASTGANRVDQCQVVALLGIINRDARRLEIGRDGLSPVLSYVTSGDGFYADGSFIQHGALPYQGGYGTVLLRGIANLLYLLEGSRWTVADPKRQTIFDAVTKSFAPFVYNGLCMDGVSGRRVSRGFAAIGDRHVQQSDHTRGHEIASAILRLADSASPAEAERWRAMVKGWIQRESWEPIADDVSVGAPDMARCLAVRDLRSIAAAAEPVNHVILSNTDCAVHRRPTWAAALSMCSARIAYYENGNGENLHGWHTSAGMLYWWNSTNDNSQYSDAFWPTVDPYRLPGTTVSRKPLTDGEGGEFTNPKPASVWVGGVTDGEFAALGQDVDGFHSTLKAKKSWFCLADAIVCLVACIG